MKPSNTPEEWRPIPGYEGHYEISSHGRARSVDRVATYKNGRSCTYRGRLLAPFINPDGYTMFSMSKHDRVRRTYAHVLVMESFSGSRPNGMEIRHLDSDPANNHLSNLAYGTRNENQQDAVMAGTHHNSSKTHCKYGHPYSRENTTIRLNGSRQCRECNRIRHRRRKAKYAAA